MTWPDLSANERCDWSSALNTVTHVSCRHAGFDPVSPMRRRVEQVGSRLGGKPATRSNVICRLRKILHRLDVIDSTLEELTIAWTALFERAYHRMRLELSCSMRFCTAKGIAPEAITDEHLPLFEIGLTEWTLQATPRRLVTGVRRAWNKTVTSKVQIIKVAANALHRSGQPSAERRPPSTQP